MASSSSTMGNELWLTASLRWLVPLWSKGNSYIWAPSQLQISSFFALLCQHCPLHSSLCFPHSHFTGCSSPELSAPVCQCRRLCISVRCFHSFRQNHLLCTCRSRKSDVWTAFPQISRITHIRCHPPWAALPGAALGSDESWGHTCRLDEELEPVCARADTGHESLACPRFCPASNALWRPLGSWASSQPTFHTDLLFCGVKSLRAG